MAMHGVLEQNGFEVAAFGSFEQDIDSKVARIAPSSVLDALIDIGGASTVDGVFASCTNLQTFAIIEQAEAALSKPVITSNQALVWHMLALTGLPTKGRGPGRLFDTQM